MADLIINTVKRYRYSTLSRLDLPEGRRYVNEHKEKLPSVTTILDATKDKSKLQEWINKVGEEEAERIKNDAAKVGTAMHAFIESHIKRRPVPYAKFFWQIKAYRMAAGLMETYFENLNEVWGNEVMLYKRGVYAGTTDLVGVYQDEPAIVDFKQTNKMKKREWIDDYFTQLTAYADAHNEQFGTDIRKGVVLMAAQDGTMKEFQIVGREFDHYLDLWKARVAQFYSAARASETESHSETASDTPTNPSAEDSASEEVSEPERSETVAGWQQELWEQDSVGP
jgi:genome maintenance exonuclease 1